MATADGKLTELETKIKFRSSVNDAVAIVKAVCRPGQSVEDLVGLLTLSLTNDMTQDLLLEMIEKQRVADAQAPPK